MENTLSEGVNEIEHIDMGSFRVLRVGNSPQVVEETERQARERGNGRRTRHLLPQNSSSRSPALRTRALQIQRRESVHEQI